MVHKNQYYRELFMRVNVLKAFIATCFFTICSYPKLVIEVFIRQDFGERYFTLASALSVAAILFVLPAVTSMGMLLADPLGFIGTDFTWYAYLAAYIFFSWKRYKEVQNNPGVFEFAKVSVSSGTIHPFFKRFRIFGKEPSLRVIEIGLEPLMFFIAGLILHVLAQKLGMLLIVCSVLYSLSYYSAYLRGDNFIMDRLDQVMYSEQQEGFFTRGEEPKGTRFYFKRPPSDELGKKLSDWLKAEDGDDEPPSVAS
jgi:hypothetical protein